MENKEYLLDTNTIVEFSHKNQYVINNILKVGSRQIIRARFDIKPIPAEALGYAQIKVDLRKKGKIVDEFDMIIGGQAIHDNMIVVTNNVKHFKNMPNVQIEDWTKS